jgi:hypothetical protein
VEVLPVVEVLSAVEVVTAVDVSAVELLPEPELSSAVKLLSTDVEEIVDESSSAIASVLSPPQDAAISPASHGRRRTMLEVFMKTLLPWSDRDDEDATATRPSSSP